MTVQSTDDGSEQEEREGGFQDADRIWLEPRHITCSADPGTFIWAGFAALLDANGLTEADVEGSPSSIQELEMFLQQYPKVSGLAQL
jgi:hypothetical protein